MLSSLTAAVRIDQIGELLRHNDAALPDLDVGINRSRLDIGIGVPVIGASGPEGTGGGTCPRETLASLAHRHRWRGRTACSPLHPLFVAKTESSDSWAAEEKKATVAVA
jgi:hypothetical protein